MGKTFASSMEIDSVNLIFIDHILKIIIAYLFTDLHQVKVETEKWMYDYNCHRSHEFLQNKSLMSYHAVDLLETFFQGFIKSTAHHQQMNSLLATRTKNRKFTLIDC